MKAIIHYIEENFKEKLTLKTIAQKAYISPEHFSRVF
ncbi:AraC family transcriptional regulator [Halobacillus rhizosphaerae]